MKSDRYMMEDYTGASPGARRWSGMDRREGVWMESWRIARCLGGHHEGAKTSTDNHMNRSLYIYTEHHFMDD